MKSLHVWVESSGDILNLETYIWGREHVDGKGNEEHA